MSSDKTHKYKTHGFHSLFKTVQTLLLIVVLLGSAVVVGTCIYLFTVDQQYNQKVYPQVFIGTESASGKTVTQIRSEWERKNDIYKKAVFELRVDNNIATISGEELQAGYDGVLIAKQAFLVGRSGNILSDLYTKLFKDKTVITPYFRWNEDVLTSTLELLAESIDVPAQDARFTFQNGKVQEFLPAKPGKRLNRILAKEQLEQILKEIPSSNKTLHPIVLAIDSLAPDVATSESNNYGIKEKLGSGYSEFTGSIPGRVHNVALAASKFHGILIAPGEIISYNKIIGEISQATGYKPAYVILGGRTVLGDGGGVCQVSTTLFRAGLNAGLPIVERTAHAYRVQYYEQANFKPGLDATVFSPSVDLKMKNDTPGHILILASVDTKKLTMQMDIYGTSDGRTSEIVNHQILSQSPAPPPLYQDDPTLPNGVVKQIDWAASGARTVFTYRVKRGNETLIDQQFYSNYRPWQAIYLKGTQS